MRAVAPFCVALVLSSTLLVADDHTVLFDEDVDFSVFKTFVMRDGKVTSARPELSFPAVMKTLTGTIRGALTARGLKPGDDTADLVVEFKATGVDYTVGPFGRASAVNPARAGRGRPSGVAVDFTEVTLVIDLSRGEPRELVWRGVYHDTESDPQLLADALPSNAATLLAQYPPRRRK